MKARLFLSLLTWGCAISLSAQTNLVIPLDAHGFTGQTTQPIRLDHIELQKALDLYATIKARTLLQHPLLKPAPISLEASGNSTDVAKAFEEEFQRNGIAVIPDGEKLLLIVPEPLTNSVAPRVPTSPLPEQISHTNDQILPAGTINLQGTVMAAVLDIYASICGRKFAPGTVYPAGFIHLRSSTPFSKAEALYAFETLFAWNGFKVVPKGGNLLEIVTTAPK